MCVNTIVALISAMLSSSKKKKINTLTNMCFLPTATCTVYANGRLGIQRIIIAITYGKVHVDYTVGCMSILYTLIHAGLHYVY